jgi:anti-anti-sigma factor
MENAIFNSPEALTVTWSQFHELVRGEERSLLESVGPLAQRQNIALDLSGVERIDAAGISALISLYGIAHGAGYCFTVSNPSPRVAHILNLVGLDRILVSHNAVPESHSDAFLERPAA